MIAQLSPPAKLRAAYLRTLRRRYGQAPGFGDPAGAPGVTTDLLALLQQCEDTESANRSLQQRVETLHVQCRELNERVVETARELERRVVELHVRLGAAQTAARVLAHAYTTDNRPPADVVQTAMGYPVHGHAGES